MRAILACLVVPLVWGNVSKIEEIIDGLLEDNVEGRSIGAIKTTLKAAIKSGYGCWCFPDDSTGKGNGEPVDQTDTHCKALNQAYECIAAEESCDPATAIYNANGVSWQSSTADHYKECAWANLGQSKCVVKTCAAEARFVGRIMKSLMTAMGRSFNLITDSQYHHLADFDYTNKCPTLSDAAQAKSNEGKTCCGSYPDKAPCPPVAPAQMTATCENDYTLTVHIPYHMKVDVVELKFGSCSVSDVQIDQDESLTITAYLPTKTCGMDNGKLTSNQTLSYEQDPTFFLGVKGKDGGPDIYLDTVEVTVTCVFKQVYTVKFAYGELSAESHAFTEAGGVIDFTFAINVYDEKFNKTLAVENQPTKGGARIHLGLAVGGGFSHDAMEFVPLSCVVSDTDDPSLNYTLFDVDSDICSRTEVDLKIEYNDEMWQIGHILFLLGADREFKAALSCEVLVCATGHGDCEAAKKCITGASG